MQELRFVAVSEDGSYAILAVPGRSGRYVLPIDERLRAVALGQTSRLAQYEIEVESPLRPKEIQARIRAGETAEEIADAAGIPVERVRWFEGPVLAERAYIADQAQAASVRRAGDSPGPGQRLGDVVVERLNRAGTDPEDAQWDSRKRGDGSWQVTLTFPSGGRLHIAEWVFDPRRRHVVPDDDNAARLSLPESELPAEPVAMPGEATVTPLAPRLGAAAGMGGSGGFAGSSAGMRTFRPERSVIPDRSLGADRSLAGERSRTQERPETHRPETPHASTAVPALPRPAHHDRPGQQDHTGSRDRADFRDLGSYRDGTGYRDDDNYRDPAESGDPGRSARPAAPRPVVFEDPEPTVLDKQAELDEQDELDEQAELAPAAQPSAPAPAEPTAASAAAATREGVATAETQPDALVQPELISSAAEPTAPAAEPAVAAAVPASAPEAAEAEPEAAATAEPAPEPAVTEEDAPRTRPAAKKNAKGRRSSVPSWDEIMLGSSRQRD